MCMICITVMLHCLLAKSLGLFGSTVGAQEKMALATVFYGNVNICKSEQYGAISPSTHDQVKDSLQR